MSSSGWATSRQGDMGSANNDSRPVDVATIGEDVPLLEGIRTARAIRRFRAGPVPDELVRKVVEAGTFAPSGGNRQPWIFIAVTEPERRAWIAEQYRRAFDAYIEPAIRAATDAAYPATKRRNLDSATHLARTLADVPVHLFVAAWTRRGRPQLQAVYPAVQNILLACRAVGLGACLTELHLTFAREVDDFLGLPEDRPSAVLIPIGWPAIPYRRPERRSVDTVLYRERYSEK
jgi:nitroreductase